MSFQNAKLVCRNAHPREYFAYGRDVERGSHDYVMSSGELRNFAHCAARWKAGYVSPDSQSKQFGSLLDASLFSPESLRTRFAVQPDTYTRKTLKCPSCESVSDAKTCRKCSQERVPHTETKDWNSGAAECYAWLQANEGKEIVTTQDIAQSSAAIQRIKSDEILKSLLDASDFQVWVNVEWHDESGIVVKLKTLLDIVPKVDTEWAKTLGDLKCIRSASNNAFARQVYQLGWHLQGKLYNTAYTLATGEDRTEWVFIGVENYEPYQPFRKLLSQAYEELAERDLKSILKRYCHCLRHNRWPSFDDHADSVQGFSLIEPLPFMEYDSLSASMEQEPDPTPTQHEQTPEFTP